MQREKPNESRKKRKNAASRSDAASRRWAPHSMSRKRVDAVGHHSSESLQVLWAAYLAGLDTAEFIAEFKPGKNGGSRSFRSARSWPASHGKRSPTSGRR